MKRQDVLEAIVTRLAVVKEPVIAFHDGKVGHRECVLCGARCGGRPRVMHSPDCPWVRAVRATPLEGR
jgi:hypothetical protein